MIKGKGLLFIFLILTNLVSGQAWYVPSSGVYHFNIGGTAFSSYVEAGNGWILVASGDGSTSESSYLITTAMTLQSDQILPASVYSSASIIAVRMNASSGPGIPFDVQSTSAGVLSNLRNNRTLSRNTNNSDWTGVGTGFLARSCGGNNQPLNTHIYHACGNAGNLHWQVGRLTAHEKIIYSNGAKADLNLWVRAAPEALPIELLTFDATPQSEEVIIEWSTASETNNDYFCVEKSSDTQTWEEVATIAGAGNSNTPLSYSYTDTDKQPGTKYYRLKQVDFDGSSSYSPIQSVELTAREDVSIYPNPVEGVLHIKGSDISNINIYSIIGDSVLSAENAEQLDVSNLPSGAYIVVISQANGEVFQTKLIKK